MGMHTGTLEQLVLEAMASATNRPLDALSMETRLEEIGLDSLGMAAVISDLEDGVLREQLSSEQLREFLQVNTIGEFLKIVESIRAPLAVAPLP